LQWSLSVDQKELEPIVDAAVEWAEKKIERWSKFNVIYKWRKQDKE
jgi:hypothetical protein